jgi:hypothetical protein
MINGNDDGQFQQNVFFLKNGGSERLEEVLPDWLMVL